MDEKKQYIHNKQLVPNAKKLRSQMTDEERKLWYCYLKEYPVRFIRQKILFKYIADFYCPKAKLVIELDGSQHYGEKGLLKDKIRTETIESRKLTVIRIPNNEINDNFREVCEYINSVVQKIPPPT